MQKIDYGDVAIGIGMGATLTLLGVQTELTILLMVIASMVDRLEKG